MRTLVFMNTVNFVDKTSVKGQITHSTANVQFVYQTGRLGFQLKINFKGCCVGVKPL